MKNWKLWAAWGCLFVLTVGLGMVKPSNGLVEAIFVMIAMGFFVPGGLLLYRAQQDKDQKTVRIIRYVSLASLSLTVVLLIANVLALPASEQVGQLMYELLVLVSAPMICGQLWVLSLFLWACLLMGSFYKKKKA